MDVEYNGTDITEYVSVQRCWHEMNARGKADTLTLQFYNLEGLWDKWNPQAGDEIVVKNNELSTGVMVVHRKLMRGRFFTIVAASVPLGMDAVRSKTWQDVRLLQICEEIAAKHGLALMSYGVENILYPFLLQEKETDLLFLNRLCVLEGCAFLVHNKTLVVYSIKHMEQREPAEEILLLDSAKFQLQDNSYKQYGSSKITKGLYSGASSLENSSDRHLSPKLPTSVSSSLEAIRFAHNLLNHENSEIYEGYFYSETYSGIVPAAVLNMQVKNYSSWDGRYFVTKVKNDYIADRSKVFFRRIRETENV